MRLAGRVAVVTGSARGIGRAIAIGYAREGASVVSVDKLCADQANGALQEIRSVGGKAIFVQVDVSNLEDHEKLISAALRQFGRLDVLVNNAGIELHEPVLDATPSTWDQIMGVNLRGVYFLSCKAAAVMAGNGGGKIINVSSVHDSKPLRDRAVYAISKGGVAMMTRSLALELAEKNICVNSISPGAVATDMNRAVLSDPVKREKLISRIPLRRIATPEEIVGAAVFLASSESDYVTGTTIYVDGGLLLQ
jgi:glucose 1-dehydrogenase